MAKVLVADDEREICEAFRDILRGEGHSPIIASTGEETLRKVRAETPDVVFIDVQLPDTTGIAVLEQLQASNPDLPVIVMTAYGTLQTAMDAFKFKAFDYLGKPVDLARIRSLLKRALHKPVPGLSPEPAAPVRQQHERMVGRSSAMQEVFKLMSMVANTDLTVLIAGESGVGKEVVAREIHANSGNPDEPFVAINCAAIPEQLIETELFGHERGAFTDAREQRHGRFEAAGAGSLFLDEISELPYSLQSKLLRVLQERSFERVGSVTPIAFKARLMAASNRDLKAEVRAARFREDLYHRLNLVTLEIPPLRKRIEDVEALAAFFLERANRDMGRAVRGIEPAALAKLEAYSWPGNVRELEHCIKRAVLLARGSFLAAHDLDLLDAPRVDHEESLPALRTAIRTALRERLAQPPDDVGVFQYLVELAEHELVTEALAMTSENQVAASKLLGLSRTTLRKKMRPS
jgi:DNA-binding NtrC family response regulator